MPVDQETDCATTASCTLLHGAHAQKKKVHAHKMRGHQLVGGACMSAFIKWLGHANLSVPIHYIMNEVKPVCQRLTL